MRGGRAAEPDPTLPPLNRSLLAQPHRLLLTERLRPRPAACGGRRHRAAPLRVSAPPPGPATAPAPPARPRSAPLRSALLPRRFPSGERSGAGGRGGMSVYPLRDIGLLRRVLSKPNPFKYRSRADLSVVLLLRMQSR